MSESAVGGITDFIGGPSPVVGKWEIGYPTQEAKAHLVAIITARAVAECKAMESVLPPDVAKRLWDTVTERITNRHYHTWHAGWLEALTSTDADVLLLLSLMRVKNPKATEDDARALHMMHRDEVAAALAQVMPRFFDLLEPDFPHQVPADQRAKVFAEAKRVMTERFQMPPSSST